MALILSSQNIPYPLDKQHVHLNIQWMDAESDTLVPRRKVTLGFVCCCKTCSPLPSWTKQRPKNNIQQQTCAMYGSNLSLTMVSVPTLVDLKTLQITIGIWTEVNNGVLIFTNLTILCAPMCPPGCSKNRLDFQIVRIMDQAREHRLSAMTCIESMSYTGLSTDNRW